MGDLKKLIFIELISAKNMLRYFSGVNAGGCIFFGSLKAYEDATSCLFL